jgi:hypothetical protein
MLCRLRQRHLDGARDAARRRRARDRGGQAGVERRPATQTIGVIGTEATSFQRTRAPARRDASSRSSRAVSPIRAGRGGWTGAVARRNRDLPGSLARSGIDTLILRCTHYPLFRPLVAEVMGPSVRAGGLGRRRPPVTASPATGWRGRRAGSTSFFVTDARSVSCASASGSSVRGGVGGARRAMSQGRRA